MDIIIIAAGIALFFATGMAVGWLRYVDKETRKHHRANLRRIMK